VEDRFYWAALQIALQLGPRSLLHLYRFFNSGEAVFMASDKVLTNVPRLSPQVADRIIRFRKGIDTVKIAESLLDKGIKVTMLGESDYPFALAHIVDPPAILYTKGGLPDPELPLMAVVGSRRATPYGKAVTRKLARDLVQAGWGVVSGMARGIDTAAHEGALDGNGYTMAVFGCGLNICYPRENRRLRDTIQEKGCLLSEFPPDTPPQSKNFPIRNRIISGCTLGTLVVEAGEKSGALITADFALEQGRDVFAVPGPVTSNYSRGTHKLLKQGAKLVETVDDILDEFSYLERKAFLLPPQEKKSNLTLEETCILQNLSLDPLSPDQLVEKTGMAISVVGATLTILECKGLVQRLPGPYYVKTDISSM
jgi:DNA processing protein